MMFAWPAGAKFFEGLVEADQRELERAQRDGCPHCGKRLDRADYPRKPRGLPQAWEAWFSTRGSLCCSRDGCRRRLTPPSVRFLGRRVYVAAVVMLGTLSVWIAASVPERTLRRWATWWCDDFVETAFFRVARARLMPPVDETALPASLVERFVRERDTAVGLIAALVFVSPLTTRSAPSSFSRDGP